MLSLDTYFDSKLKSTSYLSPIHHLQDILSLIQLYLKVYEQLPTVSEEDSEKLTTCLGDAWLYISSREDASVSIYLPLIALKEAFNLSFFEYLCLILALSTELDENLCSTFTKLCGNGQPSFHLAMCFYGITETIEEDVFSSADFKSSPLQYLLVHEENTSTLMRHSLCLHKNVVLYLTGNLNITDDYCTHFMAHALPTLAPLHTDIVSKLSHHLSQSFSSTSRQAIGIEGVMGIGKKTLLKQVCASHSINCIFLNLKKLQDLDSSALTIYISNLCFKLIVSNSLLCLTHCELKEGMPLYEKILTSLAPLCKVIFLCFDNPPSKPFGVSGYDYLHIQLKQPLLNEKILMWEFMKNKYKLPIESKIYASKYHLTIGKLDVILRNSKLLAQYEGSPEITEKHITQSILATNQIQGNAYLVKHPYTFKDLILDQATLKVLHQICNYVKYRYTVFEEWGYGKQHAYGNGLSMLFYGAPGTGKTMCASVLANEWGLDLLKVDLSRVVDKYIGETEKRLDEIFMCASQNNCVLFFDEADSLFAKRTEISSSNDKYANIEVSYLLQKMELYDGIMIMATNLVQNFDEAFKRRINFMVRFNLPSADIRTALWKKAFPSTAPISDDIDFELLGEKYELSPSVIKSIVLYAAFLASAEKRGVNMDDLLESVKYEYEKNNRMMPY